MYKLLDMTAAVMSSCGNSRFKLCLLYLVRSITISTCNFLNLRAKLSVSTGHPSDIMQEWGSEKCFSLPPGMKSAFVLIHLQ